MPRFNLTVGQDRTARTCDDETGGYLRLGSCRATVVFAGLEVTFATDGAKLEGMSWKLVSQWPSRG